MTQKNNYEIPQPTKKIYFGRLGLRAKHFTMSSFQIMGRSQQPKVGLIVVALICLTLSRNSFLDQYLCLRTCSLPPHPASYLSSPAIPITHHPSHHPSAYIIYLPIPINTTDTLHTISLQQWKFCELKLSPISTQHCKHTLTLLFQYMSIFKQAFCNNSELINTMNQKSL